ncbi:hypothetical protein DM02DRAFT_678449 [Periconia macrospinosa]|uniref:Uncharacterized protein n=1 Tax=Periconia macrospinosa TaxID=97972 RepID=A0A2V1CZE1_9PLEO|nr:hypothetical protein DM02DRAFT_678449 [Periconia macrospinosa]
MAYATALLLQPTDLKPLHASPHRQRSVPTTLHIHFSPPDYDEDDVVVPSKPLPYPMSPHQPLPPTNPASSERKPEYASAETVPTTSRTFYRHKLPTHHMR